MMMMTTPVNSLSSIRMRPATTTTLDDDDDDASAEEVDYSILK